MTGFGAGDAAGAGARITVEMKSVNHRFLDVNVKGPREYVSLEPRIVEAVRGRMRRGKIDVFVARRPDLSAPNAVKVDLPLARAYRDALRTLQSELGLEGELRVELVANQRDVLLVGGSDPDPEADWPAVRQAVETALERLAAMRADEGRRLAEDLRSNLAALRRLSTEARERAPKVVEDYRVRLQERLGRLLGEGGDASTPVDPSRLAQEVALLAERTDVHEELVRLDSHLDQLGTIVDEGGEMGRKLDFLLQEIGREVNTLGSKANDAELARTVVELKSVAERIREQVQNVE